MKSIVFFDFSTLNYAGGCELNFMNLGKWLSKKGYKTEFVTGSKELNTLYCTIARQGDHTQNISDSDLTTRFNVHHYNRFNLIDLLLPTKNKQNIMSILRNVDIIYSKNEILEILVLRLFLRIDFKKVVFGFHTPLLYPTATNLKAKLHNWFYSSNIFFALLNGSKVRFLVLSDIDKGVLDSKIGSPTIVIPNPLDTQKFSQKVYKKEESFNIYYVGRLTEQKGIDTLAESIKNLSKENDSIFNRCNFYFIGEGEKDFLLKDICNTYKNCNLLGFQNEVAALLKDADLLVAPSRAESFCYSVAEAQSTGIPVITTLIPGPKDIVIDNQTGWLIKPDNSISLKEAIVKAFTVWENDFSAYAVMGDKARENIIEKFESENINARIEEFFFSKDYVSRKTH